MSEEALMLMGRNVGGPGWNARLRDRSTFESDILRGTGIPSTFLFSLGGGEDEDKSTECFLTVFPETRS